MHPKRPVIAVDGRLALQQPRTAYGEYVYHVLTELGFMPRPYQLLVLGDLSADPEVLRRMRFIHAVDLLITPNGFTWEQMAMPQAAHGARLIHGTAGINAIFTRIPRLITVFDLLEWHRGQEVEAKVPVSYQLTRRYHMAALGWLARRAEGLFVPQPGVATELRERFHVNNSRVHLAPGAPSVPVVAPHFPKEPYIVVSGGVQATDNAHQAIAMLKTSTTRPFHVKIWVDSHRDSERCQRLVESSHLEDRIEVVTTPTVDKEAALLQSASAYLHLAPYDGLGLKAIDAMASGTPVVALNRAALREALGGAPVWVEEVGQATEALMGLMNDQEKRQDAAQRGHEKASQWSWKDTALVYHQEYQNHLQTS